MRSKSLRVIYTGIALLVAAVVFFLYMNGIAAKSNDPKALMETVGQVSGVVAGIGIAMITFALIGRKRG
jgi:hypothetical protein